MQRNLAPNEQDEILAALKDYVTETYTLYNWMFSKKPNPVLTQTLDFAELIKKLDAQHRQELQTFLDEKLKKRHYFSPKTSVSAAPESITLGIILAGLASFPASLSIYFATVLGTQAIEQVSHQFMVKSSGAKVADAFETVKAEEKIAKAQNTTSGYVNNSIFADNNSKNSPSKNGYEVQGKNSYIPTNS